MGFRGSTPNNRENLENVELAENYMETGFI